MEALESLSRCDADLGSQFISSKKITINFSGEDLQNLYTIDWSGLNGQLSDKQQETLNGLLSIVLDGVCNYNLV
jgi:hypothetical protein